MRSWKNGVSVCLGGVLVVLGVGLAGAQDAGGGPGRGGRGNWDPAQMRQRFMDRIKETLQCGEDEWKVLQPRLDKVMTLSREAGAFGGGRMFGGGRRGGEGRPQPAEADQPESATAKAVNDLQTALDNKDAKPEEIKARLTAVREAREKAKEELAKARDAVREIITQRQEAQLVMMGLLD